MVPLYYTTKNKINDRYREVLDREFSSDGIYMSCKDADRLKTISLKDQKMDLDFEYCPKQQDSGQYRSSFDEAMEYLQANHII